MYSEKGLRMKISAVGLPLSFNGLNIDYKKEIENKSDTTLKLAIGTAVAAAGLLAVYYITRGKRTPKGISNLSSQGKEQQIKTELENLKDITDKTSKEVLDKIPKHILKLINEIKINTDNFSERLITPAKNGKFKVEYKGENAKTRILINPDLSYKTQSVITELEENSVGIPLGYARKINISQNGKETLDRITHFSFDMKPRRSVSNGKEIIYGYSSSKLDTVIGHAFVDNNKYTLKFLNNPKFQKEFEDVSSIYSWAKGNFRNH